MTPEPSSPSEDVAQEEMVLKGEDEDGDVDKSEEREEEGEVKSVLSESRSQTGDDAEILEVTGEEEQPSGSPVNSADEPVLPEEGAEEDLKSRSGKLSSIRESFL